jgi:hypothetical protein
MSNEFIPDINNYNPPFYVLNDEAYNRMCGTLLRGDARFLKSYLSVCPHKTVSECKCKFYLNFLVDGKLARIVNGELKEVITPTILQDRLKSNYAWNEFPPKKT